MAALTRGPPFNDENNRSVIMMAFHRMKLEAPFKIVVAYPGYLVCVIRVVPGDIRFVPFPAEMDHGHLEIKPDFGFLQHRQIPFESNAFTVLVLIDLGIVQSALRRSEDLSDGNE